MIEQAEILEHDPDAAAQIRDRILVERSGVAPEQRDQPAGRLQREQDQPQQRGLSGARRAGEELEALRPDREGDVLQDLGPEVVAQAHILETDQTRLQALPDRRIHTMPDFTAP